MVAVGAAAGIRTRAATVAFYRRREESKT